MKTILLIEDDIALRENTAELLELAGYTVYTAPNGKVGIEKAKKENPNIIICDIMMPEIDGYGVLEAVALEESTKHIPFIFLSAKTEHKEIRKGMDMGADDYLTKPFDEEELLSAVESRLAKAKILEMRKNDQDQTTVVDEENLQNLNQLKNFFCDEGEVSTYKKGENIYRKGDHSNNMFLILKGVVKTHTMEANAKELITGLYKADDFLGFTSFDDNIPYNETATAVEETEVVGISKTYVKDILKKSQDVSLELMNLLTNNLSEIKQQLVKMAYSSVRKKTAATILQFSEIMNKKPNAPLRISRNDLATTAGIATESLIRTLSDFKRDGLIEIEGRDIRIIDMESLREIE
ncbi:response regulator [Aequorivita lipolytica]|uniref:Response regulator n=1 Tax=Aequorivita lipolytica TaxID=153267 RepID=A0A5C6YRA1_9FLAO|nr:response regulator [Aequorivita lipolytica]TXD69513.1 response regulator [Aequorivita lipolytica]SRX50992.1 Transcriptional regulatory protein CseB [Aequorivita lipolytica]